MVRPQQPGLLSRLFLTNWKNKGTSLVFAILIWAFAFENSKYDRELSVPVRITSADPAKVVVGIHLPETGDALPVPLVVEVTVKGPRNKIEEIREATPPLVGRFSVLSSGLQSIEDSEFYEGLLPGVTVESVTPKSVDVKLDKLETKTVAVEPNLQGRPASRFQALTPADIAEGTTPARVQVVGPSSVLPRVKVTTERQSIEGLEGPEEFRLRLLLTDRSRPGNRLEGVRFADDSEVEAVVVVRPRSALLPGRFTVPIRWGVPSDPNLPSFRITGGSDQQVGLSCQGTPESLEAVQALIDSGSFEIWVPIRDFSGLSVNTDEFLWPEEILPEDIIRSSVKFDPPQVLYQVELPIDDEGGGE